MISAPPGKYEVEHAMEYAGHSRRVTVPVVAFTDDGYPLFIHPDGRYSTGLVTPGEAGFHMWCLCEAEDMTVHAAVSAQPGWYALFDGEGGLERRPVVAWRGGTDRYSSGRATIMGHDDGGSYARPVDADGFAMEWDLKLRGFFHPEHCPEPVLETVIAASARRTIRG